jgi:outer membrane protein
MKYISTILSAIAVLIAGYVLITNKGNAKPSRAKVIDANNANAVAASTGANIAYVDLDTLETYYSDFKKKKAEFETQDKNLGAELERLASGLQRDAMDLDKKAQAGQMNEAQYKEGMMRLQERQQQLEQKRQNDGAGLIKKQEEFNAKLQKDIRAILEDYASDKGFDFVLAYTKTSTILYANAESDITSDVVEALNSGKTPKTSKKEEAKTTDSAASKK